MTQDRPRRFTYAAQPARVVFGAGELARLGEEIDRLEAHRALVLCTPQQRGVAERIAALQAKITSKKA